MARGGGRSQGGRKSSQGGRGSATKASPAAIERYLKGVDYPASKDDLISQAHSNSAPDDVMHIIEQLDDKEYGSPVDVSKAIGRMD